MKYVPPAQTNSPAKNVNVTDRHPLIEFAWLLAACAIVFGLIYWLLAQAVDLSLKHMPRGYEQALSKRLLPALGDPAPEPYQSFARELLAAMTEGQDDLKDVQITVLDSPEINAMAAPGDQVFLLRGLIDNAESVNEVAMVLGHELGHVRGRDALRSMGRRLVLSVGAAVIFGSNSSASRFMLSGVELQELSHSRSQESLADETGLELLTQHYGHAGGATDFFQRQQAKNDRANKLGWLSSHPGDGSRIEALNKRIKTLKIPVRPTIELPDFAQIAPEPAGETN